jgi:rubrerythrin/rhodanese-related sulfurtransferase
MSDGDLFGSPAEWPVAKLREYFLQHHPEDYQLIDVRQLPEYSAEHLPGAVWMPAEELPQRLVDLDAAKTTIVYCSLGSLSRAAAQLLIRAGYRDVHVLQGGLHSWLYGAATGLPEQFTAHLADAGNAKDQAVLAWQVEETTRQFYEAMADSLDEPEVAALFAELAAAESHHKATLQALWEALAGRPAGPVFPETALSELELMEGGTRLSEALAWAAKSSTARILDFAMAIELNAYDHYLYLQRHATDPDSQRLFEVMADEERRHLRSLGKSLEKLQHSTAG